MAITFYFKDQSKEIATDLRCQKKRKCNPLSSLSFVERECWGFYTVWATVKKQQQTARCYLILSTLTACVFRTTTTQEIDCGGANLEVAWLMKVKVKQYYYYYCGSSPTRQAPLFATNSTRVDRVSRERNVSWLCGVAVCSIWRGVKKRKTLPRFSRLNASLSYNVRWGRLGDRQAGRQAPCFGLVRRMYANRQRSEKLSEHYVIIFLCNDAYCAGCCRHTLRCD